MTTKNRFYVYNLAALVLLAVGLVIAAVVCGFEHQPEYLIAKLIVLAFVVLYAMDFWRRFGIPKPPDG